MAATNIAMDRTAEVSRGTYSLSYSPRLVRTGADFYDTLKFAAEMAVCLPTAGEEQAIYAQRSAGAKKLQDVEEFRDYFANNDENVYIWGHNSTGLRFRETDLRKSYNVGDKITALVIETDITPYLSQIADPQFTRESWKDIIDKVNIIQGEILLPYARGNVIREMHPTLGIFTEIEQTTEHKAPFVLHGWLRENLDIPQDPISGHYDVAVGRGSYWLPDGHRGCLGVDAGYGRWGAYSGGGFRPVRGSGPEGPKIEVVSANVDIEKIRQELMSQVSSDLRKLPVQDLLEKYKQ